MNHDLFKSELEKLSINLTDSQEEQLQKFYHLLLEWNQKMNLTRITIEEEVYLKHFYDSLTLAKVVDFSKVTTLCDIGSGAGFPGIILKIVYPHLHITLLDALQKRVNYLNTIIKELGLENIEAKHVRAEDYAKANRETFDLVTARAVANLKSLLNYAIPLVKVKGHFVAMKGNIEEELKEVTRYYKDLKIEVCCQESFELPIEKSKRTLISFYKKDITPKNYPKKIF